MLYNILEKAKLGSERDHWLSGPGSEREELTAGEHRELLGVVEMFYIMIVVAVIWWYINYTSINIILKNLHTHFCHRYPEWFNVENGHELIAIFPLLNMHSLGGHDLITFTIIVVITISAESGSGGTLLNVISLSWIKQCAAQHSRSQSTSFLNLIYLMSHQCWTRGTISSSHLASKVRIT